MTAEDILADAERLTKVYGQSVTIGSGTLRASAGIPNCVYVLKQNDVVLGVLVSEDRARDEAYALMHCYGESWEVLSQNCWRECVSEGDRRPRIITISAHDVR